MNNAPPNLTFPISQTITLLQKRFQYGPLVQSLAWDRSKTESAIYASSQVVNITG